MMNNQARHELLLLFGQRYPVSVSKLGIFPAEHSDGFHEGYDLEDLRQHLGEARFEKLMAGVKEDFVCGHKTYPGDHPQAGREIHCIYARDVEKFLSSGG